ncbi:MAG: plasmid pRiA4b ORF-3 family protein [Pirellulales bacterium]|nr:plasmid pRiA4b ORF-3 family protein [Pirellulales bacterium]
MARKSHIEDYSDDEEVIGLQLPVPEREVVLSSRHADAAVQERIRKAGPREVISFRIEELEDLHRGLAFEASNATDKKRGKLIGKVLKKIEGVLDEDEDDDFQMDFPGGMSISSREFAMLGQLFGGRLAHQAMPRDPDVLFEQVFQDEALDQAMFEPNIRITLSATNRATLRGMNTIPMDLHAMIASDKPGDETFTFSARQIVGMTLALQEELIKAPNEEAAAPFHELGKQLSEEFTAAAEELDAEGEDSPDDLGPRYLLSQQSQPTTAYQLKITLDHSDPAIWRQVVVADCTLDILHEIIQIAMGWDSCHLHQFEHGKARFTNPCFDLDSDDLYDETQVLLSQLVADGCKKLRYWYDFGDDWWHTIKIEKTLHPKPGDKFPLCQAGEGACPPEDCGGTWGYYELLRTLKDPKSEDREEMLEWLGEDFDPAKFDLNETNRLLQLGPAAFDVEDDWELDQFEE